MRCFTPTSSGKTTIQIASDTFTDDAGNNYTGQPQFNWTYMILTQEPMFQALLIVISLGLWVKAHTNYWKCIS